VRQPGDEVRFLQTERKSISVDSVWNSGVSSSNYSTYISKSIEGVFESGGPVGKPANGIGYLAQVRAQDISERGGQFKPRVLLVGSVELPSVSFSSKLKTLARLDGTSYLGSSTYSWGRGIAGVVYEPIPRLRVSGGLFGVTQKGTPQFQFDSPVATRGFQVRADVDLGPTKFSYLTKFDKGLGWFDREYIVSQVAGCFEPFLLYRQFPQTYTLGVRLRLDDFYEILSRTDFARKPGKTVISSPHEGHGK